MELSQIVFWKMGSLARASWGKVLTCVIAMAIVVPDFMSRSWSLTALRMDEDQRGFLPFSTSKALAMMFSAQNISVQFDTRTVLHDTGFEGLQSGDLTAPIGPNAAGKSKFFRSIEGLIKTGGSTVMMDDRNLADLNVRTQLKRVCFMPQFFYRECGSFCVRCGSDGAKTSVRLTGQ